MHKVVLNSILAQLVSLPLIYSAQTMAAGQTCEQAREKLLAPLREAKISECKSDPKNDPAWCERHFADYGNATARPGGGVNPRMFDDIPECK